MAESSPPLDLRLAESRCWALQQQTSPGVAGLPVTGRQFSESLTEAVAPPAAAQWNILTGRNKSISCTVNRDESQPSTWQLQADWPGDLRPFLILFVEFPDPQRPTMQTILHRAAGRRAADPFQPPEHAPPLLALPGVPLVDQSPKVIGFEAALNQKDDVEITAPRRPHDQHFLPVLVTLGDQQSLVTLEWSESRQQFRGTALTLPQQFQDDTLICQIRDLCWSELPRITATPCNLALSRRRMFAIPLTNDGMNITFQLNEAWESFISEFPHAVAFLKAGPPMRSQRNP